MDVKTDCFAYRKSIGRCSALTKLDCDGCHFYKSRETVCDTCPHKGTTGCKNCRGTEEC